MLPTRCLRALAILVLILAQVALGLPHHMVQGQGTRTVAALPMGDMGPGDCHGGSGPPAPATRAPSDAPVPTPSHSTMPPCGSCPESMPGAPPGGCQAMASCAPTSAAPSAPALDVLATVSSDDFAPERSAPAAREFIPDPPPPRA